MGTRLLTVGYGRWPATVRWERLLAALHAEDVQVLCDIRHSACASNLDPSHHYGPRTWHVQPREQGIAAALGREGIEYRWLMELGNPQKSDPEMAVLLDHLQDPGGGWPVHRGLAELQRIVWIEGKRCCLMCACEAYDRCHRKVVAEAFVLMAHAPLTIADIGASAGSTAH